MYMFHYNKLDISWDGLFEIEDVGDYIGDPEWRRMKIVERALEKHCSDTANESRLFTSSSCEQPSTRRTVSQQQAFEWRKKSPMKRRVYAIATQCLHPALGYGDELTHPDVEKREAWFGHIRDAIAALDIEPDLPRSEFLPADLQYLWTLFDGICGPGLPRWREIHQMDFITSTSEVARENPLKTRDRVIIGIRNNRNLDWDSQHLNAISFNWSDWQISLAVRIGMQSLAMRARGLSFAAGFEPVSTTKPCVRMKAPRAMKVFGKMEMGTGCGDTA
ncbi:hypothetical protein CLAFUW4_14575 [Fulvia fulva]|uniref:Uncharacterized protein n=1 Tax=Passalora fulva TaxID=5499 RepID=A0A9Q8UWD5_PASFU|nr:uncharacterized protein CLAFUR5_14405 [Fulvia fulva]KAK4609243.1 hypothetical protein CLAFUR4_14569 [Fulvia fulva]UJO24880.1 hypothetical protein CLAFUR5_14405 [Fulvia fulva]WPV22733.1 hypothetical protein CLAFUW4_14575 [Fulvia fulva]WPV37519.1 hypothetical protein CLAFUW7_14578 [Fulvia fulva]